MADEKTPQEQVKEALWVYTGRTIAFLAAIGSGVFIGYTQWGDAPGLRKKVDQLSQGLKGIKNERENLSSKVAIVENRLRECESRGQAAPPPANAPAAPAAPDGIVVEGAPAVP